MIRRFLRRILRLFFHIEHYEFGVLMLSAEDNGHDIIVHTCDDVARVWFSLEPEIMPYDDYVPPPSEDNYISEAHPSPEGFTFRVNLKQRCKLRWISIETFP